MQGDLGLLEQSLRIENRYVSELPGLESKDLSSRQVEQACYCIVNPTSVSNPRLWTYSAEVLETIGWNHLDVESDRLFTDLMAGNAVLPNMRPYAACYGGHQFGRWAGQLGDGRAITLGDVSHEGKRWFLQLKGAGPTPFSRRGDGRAVLRSSIREFLCSEAMHYLGIPTTRALSLVQTGDSIVRDMFYDGHPELEPGAIVCRVSETFVRFGNFQIHAHRKEKEVLTKLLDYTLATLFPNLGEPSKETYQTLFAKICELSAQLVTHWMRVGFVHGVLNTDNMSIIGETIDYGPYGWLDIYDESWTPNTTDLPGRRYCYANQPSIVGWNLTRLAEAFVPVVADVKVLQDVLGIYQSYFEECYSSMMLSKIGLKYLPPSERTLGS